MGHPLPPSGPDRAVALERRWLPDADGGLTRRVACTSVPRRMVGFASCAFDWGNSGPGAHELALSLVDAALDRMGHHGPKSRLLDGACFTLALHLHTRFVADVLAHVPEEGGSVPDRAVEAWIEQQLARLDPAQRSMLAPRYAREDGFPGEHWSLAELEEILGEHLVAEPGGLRTRSGRCVARLVQPHPLDGAGWESHPL